MDTGDDTADAWPDTTDDVLGDTALDTVDDVVPDLPADTVVDTPVDTIVDSATDTPVDTVVDTPVDTIVDSATDTPVDTAVDTVVDTAVDDGPAGCSGVLFSSDFEADNGGFTETPAGSVWDWGTIVAGAPAGSHGKVWATNLSGNYGSCQEGYLTSPSIDLSACSGATVTLVFDTWYEYEHYGLAYYDGFIVEMYSGSAWVQVAPVGGWDGAIQIYGCSSSLHVAGKQGFRDESGGWVVKTFAVSLGTYPAAFRFRFVHGSDDTGHYYGAYIDNVSLSAS